MSEGATATRTVMIWINGTASSVRDGSVVGAAMLAAGEPCRKVILGEPQAALCGIGICFECRAVVGGVSQQRTCQLVCRDCMRVETRSCLEAPICRRARRWSWTRRYGSCDRCGHLWPQSIGAGRQCLGGRPIWRKSIERTLHPAIPLMLISRGVSSVTYFVTCE